MNNNFENTLPNWTLKESTGINIQNWIKGMHINSHYTQYTPHITFYPGVYFQEIIFKC